MPYDYLDVSNIDTNIIFEEIIEKVIQGTINQKTFKINIDWASPMSTKNTS